MVVVINYDNQSNINFINPHRETLKLRSNLASNFHPSSPSSLPLDGA